MVPTADSPSSTASTASVSVELGRFVGEARDHDVPIEGVYNVRLSGPDLRGRTIETSEVTQRIVPEAYGR